LQRDLRALQAREGSHADERAFELADVRRDASGDQL
jgi:hypothetical protein